MSVVLYRSLQNENPATVKHFRQFGKLKFKNNLQPSKFQFVA